MQSTQRQDYDPAAAEGVRPHAVIAGTGRAGTSFLVQFLAACGLDTGDAQYFEGPRAGYEHRLDPDDPALPYVVKDPFLQRYCHLVDLDRITVDALIVPMRDLTAAAESRVLQERLAITQAQPSEPVSDIAAATPGGVLFSLSVADQERLLAVGFHRLLHWAMTHELPLYLLDFPRLVEDADYLIDSLSPWLGRHCDRAQARAAFAKTASPDAVRVRPGGRHAASEPAATRDLDREALLARIADLTTALEHAREEPRRPAVDPPGPGPLAAPPAAADEAAAMAAVGAQWPEAEHLVIDGTSFTATLDDARYQREQSTADRFVLAKDRTMVESLAGWLAPLAPQHIVEVGVFKGGSAALLALLARPRRLTAIEFEPEPVAALSEFIAARGLEDVIRPRYGMDQSDVAAVTAAVDADHGSSPLDLVIDDASHLYPQTRASFEVLFPRLRPGGLFMIEDWSWAHFDGPLWQHGGGYFHDRPALSNLIVEIMMVAGTNPGLIPRVTVERRWVVVERGREQRTGPLRLQDEYLNRGLPFRPLL